MKRTGAGRTGAGWIRASLALTLSLVVGSSCRAQTNCTIFTDSPHVRACRLYAIAIGYAQGSEKCQRYLDSAIRVCPDYPEAWREISVPYLKRGDFRTWRKYMDKAVDLRPAIFLGVRGWCRFKFLRDYEGALSDLERFDTLTGSQPGPSGDGSYDLHIVMALCERELGNYGAAFHYFSIGIDSAIARNGAGWVGLYDYLHRAVTKMRVKDYPGALADLDLEEKRYAGYAETWYYRGLIFKSTGRSKEASAALDKARLLFISEGAHFSDPYCEMQDQVFLTDIENAIGAVRQVL